MHPSEQAHASACADAAVRYAEHLGWRVLHLHGVRHGGGCTCPAGTACSRPGKHPDGKDYKATATTDAATLRSRFQLVPFNLALLVPDDLIVVDADTLAALRHVKLVASVLPEAPLVQTRRGVHLYFRWPRRGPSPSISALDGQKLDVIGSGSTITLPPSRTKDGTAYRWRAHLSPFDVAIPDLPATLAAHLAEIDRRRQTRAKRVKALPLTTEAGAVMLARQRARTARHASNGVARGEYGLTQALLEAGADDAVREAALVAFRAEAGA